MIQKLLLCESYRVVFRDKASLPLRSPAGAEIEFKTFDKKFIKKGRKNGLRLSALESFSRGCWWQESCVTGRTVVLGERKRPRLLFSAPSPEMGRCWDGTLLSGEK